MPSEDTFISSLERNQELKSFIKKFSPRLTAITEKFTEIDEETSEEIFDYIILLEYFIRTRVLIPSVDYMPASRSGLIQTHRLLASTIIKEAARLPISYGDIPRLTGIAADFLAKLISIPDRSMPEHISRYINKLRRQSFRYIIEFLEDQILEGSVDVRYKEGIVTEFVYKNKRFDLTLPVVKAASGIAELAPLDLYLKYIVRPNSILVLEEPESHLHPKLQIDVVRLLAMLARKGVKVLITTHSDYLLHQINILLQLSRISEADRKELGYMEDEFLTPDDVGAYLFKYDKDVQGYITEELPTIDKETNEPGIPEDSLTDVAVTMGRQTSKIAYILEGYKEKKDEIQREEG